MNFDPSWGQAGQSIQQFWQEQWGKSLQTLQQFQATAPAGLGNMPGLGEVPQSWAGLLEAMKSAMPQMAGTAGIADVTAQSVQFDTTKLQDLQQEYVKAFQSLSNAQAIEAMLAKDKRFAKPEWSANPIAAMAAANYLLGSRMLTGMAEAVKGDEKTRSRVRFGVEQWVAAMAPSNFLALNADALNKIVETKGESLAQGISNLLADMKQGHVSMTDESLFTVGQNVATTEGAVVFENELFQLIEYKPLTTKVYEKPFLMVPPCINKFYILDLQPENSVIRYAVSQGQHTFVVSWRNPDESLSGATWDDYIENGVIKAISTVQDICTAPQINVLGFCVGGTMLTTAMAVLTARHTREHGQPAAKPSRSRSRSSASAAGKTASKTTAKTEAAPFPVASMTLLTTLLDFSDTGILDIFIDENMVKLREMQMGKGGLMKGQDMASTFSFLRPNDLVWNYVVGNYLKGETPPPFDLLYWNSDSTNLPGPFYAWYLRNLYLENSLVKPGALTVCGEKVDISKVSVPVYIYGSREDHIVPVSSAYASSQVLGGELRFVMGASGHIAGVINPPAKNKRSHWLRDDGEFPASFDSWVKEATEYPGSWWSDWSAWLGSHGGKQVAAPKTYGRAKVYPVIEAAPGRYVLSKV
ncbi:alpha/beta fold hydrolase [Comamonas sp. Y33R10-2]|uniref:PHA/PHB synthase family protein n=1 Tax=Comamonas sp. Y33R10-2 TaxID=2853257 RepID=UPI001C5CB848|nr:alpha/beta fold hydrolase [Comamonas sp. Y33R10-2]QXZ11001.1 alpha/beta fold hydrolase [Comamonas sp. Y33R10-2]